MHSIGVFDDSQCQLLMHSMPGVDAFLYVWEPMEDVFLYVLEPMD